MEQRKLWNIKRSTLSHLLRSGPCIDCQLFLISFDFTSLNAQNPTTTESDAAASQMLKISPANLSRRSHAFLFPAIANSVQETIMFALFSSIVNRTERNHPSQADESQLWRRIIAQVCSGKVAPNATNSCCCRGFILHPRRIHFLSARTTDLCFENKSR